MTPSLRLHSLASLELTEAVRWYESKRAGLGGELLNEFSASMSSRSDNSGMTKASAKTRTPVSRVVARKERLKDEVHAKRLAVRPMASPHAAWCKRVFGDPSIAG